MIEKHFNKRNNLKNKNNIRITYCCMINMENAIKDHNAKILENKIEKRIEEMFAIVKIKLSAP